MTNRARASLSTTVGFSMLGLMACDPVGRDPGDDAGRAPRDAGSSAHHDGGLADDAGGSDAGGPDGPRDGGAASGDGGGFTTSFDCASASARFCQDFDDVAPFTREAGPEGAYDVPVGTGFARIRVGAHDDTDNRAYMSLETGETHSGGGALRTRVDWVPRAGETSSTAWSRAMLELSDPELYVRAYVYLPASSVGSAFTPFMFTEISGAYYGSVGVALREDGVLTSYGYGDTFASVDDWVDAPFPTDRWVCLEARRSQPPHGSPSFSVWLDGRALPDLPLTIAGRALDEVSFGQYGGFNDQVDVAILYDDLVVATERIGCE